MSAAALAPAARIAPPVLDRSRPTAYLRLAVAVLAVNAGVLSYHLARGDWHVADGSALSGASTLTLLNLAAAVLIRPQSVLNLLFWLAGRLVPVKTERLWRGQNAGTAATSASR